VILGTRSSKVDPAVHRTPRLRITQVITTSDFAGTERYCVEVGGELARRGHDVVVVGGSPEAMTRLVVAPVRWRPGSGTVQAVRALLQDGRRDVVHSHITKSDYVAVATAPVLRSRCVSTRHITNPRGHSWPARALAGPVRRRLDLEIAVSGWVADRIHPRPDAVLLNGVAEVPADPNADRQRRVLVAQRLAPEKDTGTALRAWAASGLAARGWTLEVAGDGQERAALERLAGELGIDGSTCFLGWLPDPAPAYRAASVLLAPAPTEPCGLVVLEAMARGLSVVAAGSGGHLETIGQHPDAALFPPGDHRAAAEQLVRLADDDGARSTYGATLRDLQRRRLSLSSHTDALERTYLEVVGR